MANLPKVQVPGKINIKQFIEELIYSHGIQSSTAKSGMKCCSCGASYKDGRNIHLHNFPRNPERCKEWVQNAKLTNFGTKKRHRLCSLHFEAKHFTNSLQNKLNHNAVPTIFQASLPYEQENVIKNEQSALLEDVGKTNSEFINFEFIDTEDLVMFSDSEEEDIKPLLESSQLHESSSVIDEPAFSLEDLCRVCGGRENIMIPIFSDEGRLLELQLKMNMCLPIQVTENDSLPLSVCQRCATRVEESFNLSSTCQKTDVMLTEMLAQQKMFFEDNLSIAEESIPLDSTNEDLDEIDDINADCEYSTTTFEIDSASPLEDQNDTLSSRDEIQNEIRLQAKVNFFQCPKCKFHFLFIKHYEDHMLTEHQIYVCKKHVDFMGHSMEELQNHKKECSQCLCSICGKTYKTKSALSSHMIFHGDKTVCCEFCGKLFYRKKELLVHVNMYHTIPIFNCSFCDKKFQRRSHLERHDALVHPNGVTLICNICHAYFSDRLQMQEHCDSHSEEEKQKYLSSLHLKKYKFQCDVCRKYFSAKYLLINHKRKNQSEKPRKFVLP